MKIIGFETHTIVVVADDDYNIYYRIEKNEVELSELDPIINLDYTPVTSSVYLDGFLSAAYLDDSNILRIDLSDRMKALKEYYSNLMDENDIEYRSVQNGFIITDPTIVEEVFAKQNGIMPPKYVIGFLSSFILFSKIRVNRNPRTARLNYILVREEDLYNGLAPTGIYYLNQRNQCSMFDIFGSFEPLAYYENSIAEEDAKEIFHKSIHDESIFIESAPLLLYKLFTYVGSNPVDIETTDGSTCFEITIKQNNELKKAFVSIMPETNEIDPKYAYAIKFSEREPYLHNVSDGTINTKGYSLYLGEIFSISNELRDYFQIIFKKL